MGLGFNVAYSLFMLVAGVYLLVAAIRGKGGVYQNENIRKGDEEKYRKTVRICCFAISPFLIATFIFALIEYCIWWGIITAKYIVEHVDLFRRLNNICFWIAIVGVVLMIILTTRMSDKSIENSKPKYEKGHNPAFDFDDEESKNPTSSDENDEKNQD